MQSVPQSNQIVDEENFLFIEIVQLIIEEVRI